MDSAPDGPRSALGRRLQRSLDQRPMVGGLLLLTVGVVLVGVGLAEDRHTSSSPSGGGAPGALLLSFGGGAGLVLMFLGSRSLLVAYRELVGRVRRAAPRGAAEPVNCRNCGVQLRRRWGRWQHVVRLGPVACPAPVPETVDEEGSARS